MWNRGPVFGSVALFVVCVSDLSLVAVARSSDEATMDRSDHWADAVPRQAPLSRVRRGFPSRTRCSIWMS
jgi:hypothetical protein